MGQGRAASSERTCRAPMRRPEQVFQASLVRALGAILTRETFFFAVPNGGYRTRTEAAILIGQGVKSGVPDLVFIHRGTPLGLELKAGKGVVTDIQRLMHERLTAAGMRVGVERTIDEAIGFLKNNGVPLRIAA